MKTILVPTDFSETGTNAVNYAAELAELTKSKLVLLHVYHVPVIIPNAVDVAEDIQLEEKSNEQLKLIAESITKKPGKILQVEYLSTPGFASDEIIELSKEKNCDLIVMGAQRARAGDINKFFGSNTVEVMKRSQCPVLIIPDKAKFQKIDKILFAADYIVIKNESVFDPLLEIAALFDSEILVFNMDDSRVHPTFAEVVEEEAKLEYTFRNLKHSYWFSEHKNIVDAINQFADANHAVMITMIKRHHNLFREIFAESTTKQMTFCPHFPLLILQEQAKDK